MDGANNNARLLDYANVPLSIGRVVSKGMASMRDLQEFYGAEDLYGMLEILAVDSHNEYLLSKGA